MYDCVLYLKHGDHFLLELYLSYPFISLCYIHAMKQCCCAPISISLLLKLCFFFAEHSLSKNHLVKRLGGGLISQLQTISPLVVWVAACSIHMLE